MGLFGDLLKGSRMKEPIRGEAQVVSCTAHSGRASWQTCRMNLVVQADGIPATHVQLSDMARADRWPTPGIMLPVTVDKTNPKKVKVEWGQVESTRDRAAQQAEALAAALNAPGVQGAMLAIDPSLQQGQPGGPVAPPQEALADADQEVDDQLARLARLGQLREAGVLTPDEFEQQKRRILGS